MTGDRREPSLIASPTRAAEAAVVLRQRLGPAGSDYQAFGDRFTQTLWADIRHWRAQGLAGDMRAAQAALESAAHLRNNWEASQDILRSWMLVRWAEGGMPVVAPTQGLAASLVLTQYQNLAVGDLPLPFDTFGVVLPRPWLGPPFEGLAMLWIWRVDFEGTSGLRVDIVQDAFGQPAYHAAGRQGDAIERWIESDETAKSSLPFEPDELAVTRLCKRLACGLCLYLAGLVRPTRRADGRFARPLLSGKRRAPQPVAAGAPFIWEVGGEIKLPRPLRDAAADFAGARHPKLRAGWKVSKRFAVRGHFRQQPVGPRPEGRREWRWVRPYLKGPEEGVVLQRTYAVDQSPGPLP